MPLARQHALSLTEVGCSYFAAKYRSVPKSLGVPEPGQVKLVLKSEYVNSRGMKKKSAQVPFSLRIILLGGHLAAVYWLCSSKANGKPPGCSTGVGGWGELRVGA